MYGRENIIVQQIKPTINNQFKLNIIVVDSATNVKPIININNS